MSPTAASASRGAAWRASSTSSAIAPWRASSSARRRSGRRSQRLSQRLPIAVFVVSSTQASVYSSLPVKLVSISRLRSDAASSATASSRESGTSALTCGSSPRCVSRA